MATTDKGDLILDAARKLFRKKGYHGTTIRDIAGERGILSGSIYAHIRTKEDLLFEITNEGADAFLQGLKPVAQESCGAIEKLRHGLTTHIRVVAEHLDASSVFLHEWRALSDVRRKVIQEKRDYYESLWTEILTDGVKNGELQVKDIKFARLLILSVANSVYQWYDPHGSESPEQIANHFMDLILQGMAQIQTSQQ